MYRILLVVFVFFLHIPEGLMAELICRPVVNVYIDPKEDTEIDSQALYGDVVEIVEQKSGWSKITMVDGITGWVLSSQVISNPSYEKSRNLRPLKSLFAHIYRVKDTIPYPPLLTIPYGTKVKLDKTVDTGERWVSIELLSGEKAWIQRGDIDFAPKHKTLEEVLIFSKSFLGIPYTWGGRSSYGYDCSGFVQMLFREMGLHIPRNSGDQAKCGLFIPVEREDLQPGDLLFFGTKKITHVGIYLGNGQFIHSGVKERPMVMISSLETGKYPFKTARRINRSMIASYQS